MSVSEKEREIERASKQERERASKRERARARARERRSEREQVGPACWLHSSRAHLIVENDWQPVALCFGVVGLQLEFIRLRWRRHLGLS